MIKQSARPESGLPLLIDDGTNGYVHQGTGNPLTQTGLSSGTPKWLLTDALGSVRGATDAAGALTGSANYDTFGAPYGTDSTGSKLGFTGEQRDSETGLSISGHGTTTPAMAGSPAEIVCSRRGRGRKGSTGMCMRATTRRRSRTQADMPPLPVG